MAAEHQVEGAEPRQELLGVAAHDVDPREVRPDGCRQGAVSFDGDDVDAVASVRPAR